MQIPNKLKQKLQSAKELYALGVYNCTQYANRRDTIINQFKMLSK